MQTIVFTEDVATLCNRLEVEPLINLLAQPIERGGESPVTPALRSEFFRLILSAHTGLVKTTEEGGPGKRLATAFGVEALFSSEAIAPLISSLSLTPDYATLQENGGFLAFYFSLKQFRSTVTGSVSLLQEERMVKPEDGVGVLELEMPADAGTVSAEKFSEVIQHMVVLHGALARYGLGRDDDLVILSLDSGGPLLIGFQFSAVLVARISEIFASAIRWIRVHKTVRFEENVELAVAGLQLLKQLDEAVTQDHIGEDEAAVAKAAITRSMESLLVAGVLPRGMVLERKIASSVLSDVKEPLLLPPWKESDEESPRRIQTARRSQAIRFEPGKDLMK